MDYNEFIQHCQNSKVDISSGGDQARCDCPACGAKRGLSITRAADGKALVHCHGGCTFETILKAVGVDPAKFSGATGCTLTEYAVKTGLPVHFLRGRGLSDGSFKRGGEKIPAVVIAYLNEAGEHAGTRYRIAPAGDDKFRWAKGTKARTLIYGAEHIAGADPKQITVVEGESDVLTMAFHEFPVVGLPGAAMLDCRRLNVLLAKFDTINIVIEPDRGGEEILKRLPAAPAEFRDKVRLISCGEFKDPNAMFKADPANFKKRMNELMAAAPTLAEFQKIRDDKARADKAALASELIACQDILGEFAKAVKRAGLSGERRNAQLLYLAITSRLTASPVNTVLQGLSAAGKSFTVKSTLAFFPPFAVVPFTSMSERALIYYQDPLSHRMIYIAEAPGMDNEFLNYIVRTLLSEKEIRYLTVEKSAEGELHTVEKIVPGPTGMITTTTRFSLHPENATRCLFLQADDSPEQTARILAECFEQSERNFEVDLERWHAYQAWLEGAVLVATIPFREAIYRNIPPAAVRLRRDAGVLQILIQTHAILHQKNRQIDERGRVVAAMEDYAAVHELVADLMAEQAATGATASDIEFFGSVVNASVMDEQAEGYVTTAMMVSILKKDRVWMLRRLGKLAKAGYLNKDTKRREHRFYLAENTPGGAVPILPSPATVAAWMKEHEQDPEPAAVVKFPRRDPGDWQLVETEAVAKDGATFN